MASEAELQPQKEMQQAKELLFAGTQALVCEQTVPPALQAKVTRSPALRLVRSK
jgi:hypothetical protein